MTGIIKPSRLLSLLAGAIAAFLANRYSVGLLISAGMPQLPAAIITLLSIYGLLFLICDFARARRSLAESVYFFFRGACIGALYLAPYIAAPVAPLAAPSDSIIPLFLVGAILIFFGHILTRIMFSATDETEFYR